MQSPSQIENLRDSYRYPIEESQQSAQMLFGKTWTPVELLDESAGGFGILVDLLPDVAVGDVVRLRCGVQCFEVEVMHVAQCPTVDGSHDERRGQPPCQLGVRRVSEVFPKADAGLPWFQRIRARWQLPHSSLDGKGLGVGLAIAFFVGVLPAVAVLSLRTNYFADRESKSAAVGNSLVLEMPASFSNPFKVKLNVEGDGFFAAAPHDGFSAAVPSLNDRQKAVWQLLLDRAKLQTDIEPWNNATLAVIANQLGQMSLSDLQQLEISQLLKYTDVSLTRLDAANYAGNREEAARKGVSILKGTYTDLMQMLSDKQQSEWDKLTEKRGEEASSTVQSSDGKGS